MPGFTLSARCRAPVEDVWKLLFDPARFPDWYTPRIQLADSGGGQTATPFGLTPREQEVLRLVAAGRGSRPRVHLHETPTGSGMPTTGTLTRWSRS